MSNATAPKIVESINLFCRKGSSDKVYCLFLEEVEGGFVVRYQNGKRGKPLTGRGFKIETPVAYETAKKRYDSVVREKMNDDYLPGGDVAEYVPPSIDELDVPRPQLLNAIARDELEDYLTNDDFCAQEKMDGERRMMGRTAGEHFGTNRKGRPAAFNRAFADALDPALDGDYLLDGEDVGEVFHVFDILKLNGTDHRSKGFIDRFDLISEFGVMGVARAIRPVPVAIGTAAKRALLARVEAEGGEGLVFKRIDAPYASGRPASGGDHIKFRFKERATVRVRAHNDKRSVVMEMVNEAGEWIDMGSVTIPPNKDVPAVGALIEVEYPHAIAGGDIQQAVYIGPRTDLDIEDAKTCQLRIKPGTAE